MSEIRKVTINDLVKAKAEGRRITMLTAYDCPTAQVLESADVDIILVGDSLGNVILGYDTTLPVTMEDMIHHTAAVARGVQKAMVVADMPFMSFQVSREEAVRNAGRFLKEAGAEAVKLEGGERVCGLVTALVEMGIPVMGHVGLTPQSVFQFGGYRVQGREEGSAREILQGARALEDAGAFSVVLEGIPGSLAGRITESLSIPTIGIGAGPDCDGQVLVLHDMLGMYRGFRPKFVKVYAEIGRKMEEAVKEFVREVKEGDFPGEEHTF